MIHVIKNSRAQGHSFSTLFFYTLLFLFSVCLKMFNKLLALVYIHASPFLKSRYRMWSFRVTSHQRNQWQKAGNVYMEEMYKMQMLYLQRYWNTVYSNTMLNINNMVKSREINTFVWNYTTYKTTCVILKQPVFLGFCFS